MPTKVKSHIDFGKAHMSLAEYRLYFCNVIADAAATVANSLYDYADGIMKEVEAKQALSFLACVRFWPIYCKVNDLTRFFREITR